MKLKRHRSCAVVKLNTKLDRKKHVACSSRGVCKPFTSGAYDQPKESSRVLLLLWRPQVEPSKEEVTEFAMLLMGEEKPVSGMDQVELKSKGSSCVEGGKVKLEKGELKLSVGELKMAVGEMDALCNTAISEDGDDQADLETVSHDASDNCGEPRRLPPPVVLGGE